jgi:phosphinothricin acetyltransferase
MIRTVLDSDVNCITDIYNYYIQETAITFEEQPITSSEMLMRIAKIRNTNLPWLVAEDDSGVVVGYAYATQWRERFAYRFSVEITVYLLPSTSGRGLGSQLYSALFSALKCCSVHSVIAGITLPNPKSIALHEKFAMKQVATFDEVGFKFDTWHAVGYWQGKIT